MLTFYLLFLIVYGGQFYQEENNTDKMSDYDSDDTDDGSGCIIDYSEMEDLLSLENDFAKSDESNYNSDEDTWVKESLKRCSISNIYMS